jgi:RNA polymerase sigma-70 factor (ECF subfamily)
MLCTVATAPEVAGRSDSEERWAALIDRIAVSDLTALAELYDQTSRLVYGLVLRIVVNPADAEDVTFDVYTQIWKQASRFDFGRGKPSAWIFTIARSRALDCVRARGRRQEDRQQPIETLHGYSDESPSPREASDITVRRQYITAALGKVASDQREAIELAFFGGLSHSEIAERLGQPLGTVKTRIRLGMRRLRDELQPLAGEL